MIFNSYLRAQPTFETWDNPLFAAATALRKSMKKVAEPRLPTAYRTPGAGAKAGPSVPDRGNSPAATSPAPGKPCRPSPRNSRQEAGHVLVALHQRPPTVVERGIVSASTKSAWPAESGASTAMAAHHDRADQEAGPTTARAPRQNAQPGDDAKGFGDGAGMRARSR